MEDKSLEMLKTMPVPKAVIRNVLPAMAAMIMVLFYNLADTFFIGQTHDALQVAAVSLASPVFLLFMSMGSALGIGGASVISRALGEGRREYAKKVCSFCMWICVGAGIVLTVLCLALMDTILSLIGASADTWEFARTYLSIVVCSGPFMLIANCYSNIVRAEGEAGRAMAGQVIGNILNIILDPIMILVFGWNIAGAAIATVIGNICASAYYISFYLRGRSSLSIRLKDFTIKDKVCSGVLSIGLPTALGTTLMSFSEILANNRLASYGDMAVAGMGVAHKVINITGMVCMGLGQGIQPLVGYCVGAKLKKRLKNILKFSIIFAFALGIAMTAACYLLINQLVGVFLTDVSAFEYGVLFAEILLSTEFIFGAYYVLVNTLQAMGAAKASLILNVSRQGFVFIPTMFLLEGLFGLIGLAWAQPVANVLSAVLLVALFVHTYKKLNLSEKEVVADQQ